MLVSEALFLNTNNTATFSRKCGVICDKIGETKPIFSQMKRINKSDKSEAVQSEREGQKPNSGRKCPTNIDK